MTAARWAALRALAMAFALAPCCRAQSQLPAFSPAALPGGVIRSWGDDAMRSTLQAWENAFRKYHPGVRFEDNLLGTATSMAGIITNTSDLSLMGRPADVNEIIGFEWVHRVKPLGIQVMNGPLHGEGRSPALAVFVSRNNPLQQISLAQLAAILSCPSDPAQAVTWSAAGVQGPWSRRPVHAFLYDDQTGTGAFLMQAVQGAKDCWNWSMVHEFKDSKRSDGSIDPAGRQIMQALAHDPNGLALSTLGYAVPSSRALPITVNGAPIRLTAETIVSGAYPLSRGAYIYIHRPKDKPVDPLVAEFLRFILSAEGQSIVSAQGDFLPLNPSVAAEQRKKLE